MTSHSVLPVRQAGRQATPKRGVKAMAAALALALSLSVSPLAFAQQPPVQPGAGAQQLPSFSPLVKKVLPAVVSIQVTEKAAAASGNSFSMGPGGMHGGPFDEMLRRFFEQQQGQGGGDDDDDDTSAAPTPSPRGGGRSGAERVALGSGFIIDPTGYIVTNNHVVGDGDKVTVVFQDNSKHPAKIIGKDAKTDLALVKIETDKPLPFVSFGDSNGIQVGDWVLAVGNPFGLGGTVSSGIISARGRDIHAGPYDDFLQIDAAINRGNSGGPTFNLNGDVIGINTAIYSPNGGSVGIGFAIPASLAKPVIDQIRAHGKVDRGWLGVQIQEVTPEIAKGLGLKGEQGALVADVTAGGPAQKSGLKQGDVITKFNGHAITKVRDLPILVAETPVGQKAQVTVWRKGGEVNIDTTLASLPDDQKVADASGSGKSNRGQPEAEKSSAMGLRLGSLTDKERQQFKVQKGVQGVIVTGVSNNSPLAQVGIRQGDVIVQINQQQVKDPADAVAKLKEAQASNDKNLLLLLNRQGVNQFVAVTVQPNAG